MRRSVKIMVGGRVVAAFLSMLLFSVFTTKNIISIDRSEETSIEVNALLTRVQQAETAHYKWASNLNNALYAGTEFTGSTDPTGCVLGQWIYGEAGTDDETILSLRAQLEPLHRELHQSATHVLDLLKTDPEQEQKNYQETIMDNLSVLVGLLDEVIERGTTMNEASTEHMQNIVSTMHIVTAAGLCLALICLISLVSYVMKRVVRPILLITDRTRPLQEGCLNIELNYNRNDGIYTKL